MLNSKSSGTRPRRAVEAEVIDPAGLSSEKRDIVLRRLYRLHQIIFAGVSMDQFAYYLIRPDAIRTRIQVYRNEQGGLVGYCAVHLFELPSDTNVQGVLRAEAGLLVGYRGSGLTLWFGAREAFRYKAHHPFRTVVLYATLVHPSSYHMLCKYLWRCYPYPGRRTPERWRRLILQLAESFGDEPIDVADPFIRRVGWITREDEAGRARWCDSSHDDVRYFVSRNPGYTRGHGMAVIAPLSVSNLVVSLIQYAWHFTQLWLERLRLRATKRHSSDAAFKKN